MSTALRDRAQLFRVTHQTWQGIPQFWTTLIGMTLLRQGDGALKQITSLKDHKD